jgi:hypothetical protein
VIELGITSMEREVKEGENPVVGQARVAFESSKSRTSWD